MVAGSCLLARIYEALRKEDRARLCNLGQRAYEDMWVWHSSLDRLHFSTEYTIFCANS